MLSPELFEKWEHIIDDIEMTKVPLELVKKIVLKLGRRKQKTINVRTLLNQGFDIDEIEEAVSRQLEEYDDDMLRIEFILDVEGIAKIVQPETDELLKNLK
jgi:SOS response regulatory protein OraA/RecX